MEMEEQEFKKILGHKTFQCLCHDWQKNIMALNAPYKLNLTIVGEYTGKQFKFCPWCSKALIEH